MYYIELCFLKKRFVSFFITNERPSNAIKFGNAMSPFIISVNVHTVSNFPIAPIKTTITHNTLYGFIAFSPAMYSTDFSP